MTAKTDPPPLLCPQSQDTVLDVLLDCRRLSMQLPAARWSQQVREMVETLLSNSVVFLSRNLGGILVSDK